MQPAGDEESLLVTASLDRNSFDFFQAARIKHFPPALNVVPAHVMLFHRLPASGRCEIEAALQAATTRRAPIAVSVSGVQLLGRGVAYQLSSPELVAVHDGLKRQWDDWLSLQDRQSYRPHVTIQNKVHFETARTLCEELSAGFQAFPATVTGIGLWFYRRGPWEHLAEFSFPQTI